MSLGASFAGVSAASGALADDSNPAPLLQVVPSYSPPERVVALVSAYTGLALPKRRPGTYGCRVPIHSPVVTPFASRDVSGRAQPCLHSRRLE